MDIKKENITRELKKGEEKSERRKKGKQIEKIERGSKIWGKGVNKREGKLIKASN